MLVESWENCLNSLPPRLSEDVTSLISAVSFQTLFQHFIQGTRSDFGRNHSAKRTAVFRASMVGMGTDLSIFLPHCQMNVFIRQVGTKNQAAITGLIYVERKDRLPFKSKVDALLMPRQLLERFRLRTFCILTLSARAISISCFYLISKHAIYLQSDFSSLKSCDYLLKLWNHIVPRLSLLGIQSLTSLDYKRVLVHLLYTTCLQNCIHNIRFPISLKSVEG